ncbi:MAG: hypothetical protein QOI64_2134 [Solirubrobacteraceae bacterium]|jgi:hypothetical protein|nr:hypothetical protein [Solirubrobacteraceae bacterium]
MTATTASSPPRQGPDLSALILPDRRNDWLRLIGGVLLAAGFVVLYIRKFQDWGDFPLLLVVLIPFVVLYGLGWLAGLRVVAGGGVARPQGWQTVYLIIGSLLAGFVVAQLLLLLGADDLNARLHQVLIGLAVAVAAFAASFLRAISVLTFVGGLAALWAWLFLLDKIFGIDSVGGGRAALLVFAALAVAAAFALRAAGRAQGAELITVAGIVAVLAGLLSLSGLTGGINPLDSGGDRPSETWNVFILVVSIALIAYGTTSPVRGPSYVGAIGLASFVGLAGSNVVALSKGNADDVHKLAGWPLVLLVLGIAVLAATVLLPRRPAGGPTAAPPVTSPPPGGAPPPPPA